MVLSKEALQDKVVRAAQAPVIFTMPTTFRSNLQPLHQIYGSVTLPKEKRVSWLAPLYEYLWTFPDLPDS